MSNRNERDYNVEIGDVLGHKYAYNFDMDVMHGFMIRSFEPFFRKGTCLELGSFKGKFTKRLLSYFGHITCIEASSEAAKEAESEIGRHVTILNSEFDKSELSGSFDNIVLAHVLEHLDDPIALLKKVNDEWLSPKGRLFLVCPNAHAASRQIAVKMGLISHRSAVTPAEAKHGHRITYSFDTLERDAKKANLKVVYRTGIFFKALANFQWDQLLETEIVTPEYLEGCYQLGQEQPDLCASIFLLCEKGEGQSLLPTL